MNKSSSKVLLLGLDIGSTTSHLMVAEAEFLKNCVTGRMEFSAPKIVFKSEPIFTPFKEREIDLSTLSSQVTAWLKQSGISLESLKGGGAIVTGLASKKDNAKKIKQLVKGLISESLIATAEDPHLESWMAFKGNCFELSSGDPSKLFLNLDIGGGTTNLAVGRAGEVLGTGCLFIGARHFQFKPGTYLLTSFSDFGERLLKYLKIEKKVGEILKDSEIKLIVDEYVKSLEELVKGSFSPQMEKLYDYFPNMQLSKSGEEGVFTFSGGVGELLYQYAAGGKRVEKTQYGDLGEELALGILESKILSKDLKQVVPSHAGRATVFGIALYQVEVSGSTLYLSKEISLPLEDIPIIGQIDLNASDEILEEKIKTLSSFGSKVGVYVIVNPQKAREQFIHLAKKIKLPKETTLVLFLENNLGKTLGNYLTDWENQPFHCIVVDEVPLRNAEFASLGAPIQSAIPVSFYGLRS